MGKSLGIIPPCPAEAIRRARELGTQQYCILIYVDKRLEDLRQALEGQSQLLIIPHNDPDPDAIAASVGLRYLVSEVYGLQARIGYRGIIGRSENKELVRYLDRPLERLGPHDISMDIPVALVDSQPGVGNNPLPANIPATIVIDHHAQRGTSSQVRFVDIRPEIGATATIITGYIQAAGLDFPTQLSTALFYGIKTDTMGLARCESDLDLNAYLFLQPRVDIDALTNIERAQVPLTYFKSLTNSFQASQIYDKDLVIAKLGEMDYPDLGAEIGDLLLRLQGVMWVICIGVYKGDLILSVRSRNQRYRAGNIARVIIGDLGTAGGHGTMAGGQIRLGKQDPNQLSQQLTRKALEYLKGDGSLTGSPLT